MESNADADELCRRAESMAGAHIHRISEWTTAYAVAVRILNGEYRGEFLTKTWAKIVAESTGPRLRKFVGGTPMKQILADARDATAGEVGK